MLDFSIISFMRFIQHVKENRYFSVILPTLVTGFLCLIFSSSSLAQTPTIVSGPSGPGNVTSNNANAGTVIWNNAINALLSDNVYAVTAPSGSSYTYRLVSDNFAFSIPAINTIDGIEVRVEWLTSAAGPADQEMRLNKAGVFSGTNKAVGTAIPTVESVTTYGSPTDLWGNTWTPADINAATFGAGLAVQFFSNPTKTVSIDQITITVYHHAPLATSAITPSSACQGGAVNVPYTISTTFAAGNIFTAQLSDASGSFATPVNIGSLTSQIAGTIAATIPAAQPTGSLYRIRVVSSNPVFTATDNGANLSVSSSVPGPVTATAATGVTCETLTANWTASANALTYYLDVSTVNTFATFLTGFNNLNVGNVITYNLTGLNSGTTYYYRVRAESGCGLTAFSNTISALTTGAPQTYIVTSLLNGTTVDGVSLRWAITQANANCGHDFIKFNLGLAGPYTIALSAALPNLTDNAGVTIDGWSNTGNNGTPNSVPVFNATVGTPMNPIYKVIITSSATNGGINIASDNNVIQGLTISAIGGNSVVTTDIAINIISGTNNSILGNYLGMNANGATQGGTALDVGILVSGSGNMIGDGTPAGANLIAGLNGFSGIRFTGAGSTSNSVKGNMIGIQSDGSTQVAGNGQIDGIRFLADAGGGNTIGGVLPGEGNVISGNLYGIYLLGSTPVGNRIVGNIIGPQANGTTMVPSNAQVDGIWISGSQNNIIGGNTPGARNIISANSGEGIYMASPGCSGNIIKGNYIGLDKTGTSFIASTSQNIGIWIALDAGANNIIGGSGAGEGNVISGNYDAGGVYSFGVYLSCAVGNNVVGNIIGPQKDGISYVAGNLQVEGVDINNSPNNIIGGSIPGSGNIISGNETFGIVISGASSTGTIIKGNNIGIDINGTTFITGSTQNTGILVNTSAGSGTIIGGTGATEGNLISGQSGGGVLNGCGINIVNTSGGVSVLGNIVGPQKNGTSYLASNNQVYGVLINSSPNNIIGGSTVAARNILSANEFYGFQVDGAASTGNIVKGNYIGIDKSGTSFITGSTQNTGVYIQATCGAGNTIGGSNVGEGNVISGNNDGAGTGIGVNLISTAAGGNTVIGNIIGPQANGTSYVTSNLQIYGVQINNSPANKIGGNSAGTRNVISANETAGVFLTGASSTGNIIKGNYIGIDKNAAGPITGSSQDYGVLINTSAANNTIGSTAAGEANIIAFNTVNGLNLTSLAAIGNKISGNPIYKNTGKEININYGPTQANSGLAFPVITSATGTAVSGTSAASATVEIFNSPSSNSCFDAQIYLGTVIANGTGNWTLATALAGGDTVIATATNAANSTSEFSSCVPVLSAQTITTSAIAPTLLCSGGAVKVSYTITGTFNAGNIFTAQLSDAAGSFAAPVSIGTLVSTIAGTINATIPAGAATGANYRIRVIASNPVTTGTDNGANLTVPADGGAGTWTWVGTVSTSWFDPCNWDKKCLPDLNSDVIIPGATPSNPLITGATGACKTISIQVSSGAKVTIDTTTGGKLQVTQ
jgi:hypothetical protein